MSTVRYMFRGSVQSAASKHEMRLISADLGESRRISADLGGSRRIPTCRKRRSLPLPLCSTVRCATSMSSVRLAGPSRGRVGGLSGRGRVSREEQQGPPEDPARESRAHAKLVVHRAPPRPALALARGRAARRRGGGAVAGGPLLAGGARAAAQLRLAEQTRRRAASARLGAAEGGGRRPGTRHAQGGAVALGEGGEVHSLGPRAVRHLCTARGV